MSVKTWLWQKALKKAITIAIQGTISVIGADQLSKLGVQVDQTQMTVGLLAILEAIRNWLKHKFPTKLGWL